MTIKRPHILFHRPTIWDSDIQCSTKLLARLFGEHGFNVTYLHNPIDPAHFLLGRKNYIRTWKDGPQNIGRLRVVTPASPIPVRDKWPLDTLTASKLKYRFCAPSLSRSIEVDKRGAPDLIWTTVPGSASAFCKIFPNAKIVFHVIDYYPAFRGASVKHLEKDDYTTADAIYVIGDVLKRYLTEDLGIDSAKISVLGQGVELKRYDAQTTEPLEIADLPHPRAVWCGVLGKGDPDLFTRTAQELEKRNGSLILIGPGAKWADELVQSFPKTVHLLGSRSPENLPAYLCHSDIGVMLYDQTKQEVYQGQNPLKLYEYAAAGLPIISTSHDEFDTLNPPVQQVRNSSEIPAALDQILSNISHHRSSVLDFANRHSWHEKVSELTDRFFPEWDIKGFTK